MLFSFNTFILNEICYKRIFSRNVLFFLKVLKCDLVMLNVIHYKIALRIFIIQKLVSSTQEFFCYCPIQGDFNFLQQVDKKDLGRVRKGNC